MWWFKSLLCFDGVKETHMCNKRNHTSNFGLLLVYQVSRFLCVRVLTAVNHSFVHHMRARSNRWHYCELYGQVRCWFCELGILHAFLIDYIFRNNGVIGTWCKEQNFITSQWVSDRKHTSPWIFCIFVHMAPGPRIPFLRMQFQWFFFWCPLPL